MEYKTLFKKYPDMEKLLTIDSFFVPEVIIEYKRPIINSKWIETKRTIKLISTKTYLNYIDFVPFYKIVFKAFIRIETTKTKYGFLPTKEIFIHKDKKTKVVTRYLFN